MAERSCQYVSGSVPFRCLRNLMKRLLLVPPESAPLGSCGKEVSRVSGGRETLAERECKSIGMGPRTARSPYITYVS